MQSAILFVYKFQLQKIHENPVTSSVWLFVYKKVTEIA